MNDVKKKLAIKEFSIYLCLFVIVVGIYIADNRSDRRTKAFQDLFLAHEVSMKQFLAGWSRYDHIVTDAEISIIDDATNERLAPFSCEAAFIREHKVCPNGEKAQQQGN